MRKFLRIYADGRKSSGLKMSLRGRPVVFRPLVTRSEVCYLGSWGPNVLSGKNNAGIMVVQECKRFCLEGVNREISL